MDGVVECTARDPLKWKSENHQELLGEVTPGLVLLNESREAGL